MRLLCLQQSMLWGPGSAVGLGCLVHSCSPERAASPPKQCADAPCRPHPCPVPVPQGLGLEPAWDSKIAARVGRWFWGRAARPADKKRLFLEYPSAPVKSPIELPCPSAATMSPGEEEALKRELERLEKGGVGVRRL